jgi:hypothetical protein
VEVSFRTEGVLHPWVGLATTFQVTTTLSFVIPRACDLLLSHQNAVDGKDVPPPQQLRYPLATVLSLSTALSLSSRAYSDFLLTALTGATYVVLPKENHMQLIEAATLDRKSGEAEGSAVLRTLLGYVFRQSGVERSAVSFWVPMRMLTDPESTWNYPAQIQLVPYRRPFPTSLRRRWRGNCR